MACAVRRHLADGSHLSRFISRPNFAATISAGTRAITEEEIWRGEVEHHFLLIAARNLLRAIELHEELPDVDSVLRPN